MSNIAGLNAALQREVNKLVRQTDAIETTKALIEVLRTQIEIAEKKK